jgi:hypothetical protein
MADLMEMGHTLEAQPLMETEGRQILRIHRSQHHVLPRPARPGNEFGDQEGADPASAPGKMHVDGVFQGETVSRPGAKIAEGGKPGDRVLADRDLFDTNQNGIALIATGLPPGKSGLVGGRRAKVWSCVNTP